MLNLKHVSCYQSLLRTPCAGFLFRTQMRYFQRIVDLCNFEVFPKGHDNNIPTMQIFTGISRNIQSNHIHVVCCHWLSVSEISKIMHCGTLSHVSAMKQRLPLPGNSWTDRMLLYCWLITMINQSSWCPSIPWFSIQWYITITHHTHNNTEELLHPNVITVSLTSVSIKIVTRPIITMGVNTCTQ